MTIVEAIEIEPNGEEVLRLLRRRPSGRAPDAWTQEVVEDAREEAWALVRPRGVYGFFERSAVSAREVFDSAVRVGLCIATVGPELEARVAECMRRGDLVRGVVLDAVGSEMAEATARALDLRMETAESREGHLAGARFSPGYGPWDLEGQREVFGLLDAGGVGVRLTPTMMMVPRKSVSFAVNYGPNPQPPRCSSVCGLCEKTDCAFRRE